ncbi:NmrA family NAD(P)-binding protein [Saccharopolyspora sp. NPDC047091]|uniref:NmrA family NAD(P)-binding protein n=1 Tax=Saccharopolyspora sp. NPDC047091 TaxID=3155924 RepID=UPI0033E3D93C
MPPNPAPVLVTGATGKQGGATARALLAAGVPVRALVRDATTGPATELRALGAELVTGDLRHPASLPDAVRGARAVFSVQMPEITADGFDFAGEVSQGGNLVEAARAAEVPQFVHTSVSGAGQHTRAPGWAEGRWRDMAPTLDAKSAVQDLVRAADFPSWTLLKPPFFMENFRPEMAFLFPRGVEGGLVSVIKPDTELALIAVADIGAAAAAAFAEPERFHRVELELASDRLPMTRIAEILTGALGVPLTAPDLDVEAARAAGMPEMGSTHEWLNAVGQPARPEFAAELGLPTTSFEEWATAQLRG